jgi:hypothetical protein
MLQRRSRNASKKFLSGDDVKAWRISRNVTQPELADWLGLTPQSVAYYESSGATKGLAMALSAIDRGLTPYKPTRGDLEELKKHERFSERNGHESKRKKNRTSSGT